MRGVESEGLLPVIDRALSRAGITAPEIDRLVCGSGPGSFTGLRLAASIAKGLAMGLGRPLFAVPSLGLLVAAGTDDPGTYVATLDALRGEWFAGVYERFPDGQVAETEPSRLGDRATVDRLAARYHARVLGAIQPASIDRPSARGILSFTRLLESAAPVDLDGWQPTYGRHAEAQVKWEAAHGRPLDSR